MTTPTNPEQTNLSSQIIVVGGGLAGLSAAHTIYENGGNVLVIDKNPFFGGNSTKATSGINGALTNTQIQNQINDSCEKFYQDTLKSARDLARPDLIKVLTYNSGNAVDWLQSKFKIDLSLVSRLGGHSYPRTHRGTEKFPGMTITYALMEELEELARKEPNRVVLRNKSKVVRLIKNDNKCVGCVYLKNNQEIHEYGPVILATGGYAADFTSDSLLKKYRPEYYDLPTTNGDHSTGDGIKLANEFSANLIDMEKVQVHPTGLIDPKEPDAKTKFLAAEALRGVGGILINGEGKRFVDELQHRDFVTNEIWKTKLPIRLVLNSLAGKEIEWHIKHYMGRGLMRKFTSAKELASEMGVSEKALKETFDDYNKAAKTKQDKFKKKYFHNVPFEANDTLYVALMTPVLHFTMGGVEIDQHSQVLGKNKQPIQGLFGAGEMCGGVHGANRLGGSSLLGCVVYGRVSGASATRYQLQSLSQTSTAMNRLGNLSSHISSFTANLSVDQSKITLELDLGNNGQTSPSHAATYNRQNIQQTEKYTNEAQALTETKDNKQALASQKSNEQKKYTYEQVAEHNKENDCWVVVNNQVLNVTDFMHEHPGGKKAIMLYAGKEASEEFNMLHKKDVVQKYAPETIMGFINDE